MKNYNGPLEDMLGKMVALGTAGCGFEQHLWSMQRALQNTTANPGFLRPEAYLAVIVVAVMIDRARGRIQFSPRRGGGRK